MMSVTPQRYIKNVFYKKIHKYTFSAKTSNTSLNINAIGAVYIRCTSGVLRVYFQKYTKRKARFSTVCCHIYLLLACRVG